MDAFINQVAYIFVFGVFSLRFFEFVFETLRGVIP